MTRRARRGPRHWHGPTEGVAGAGGTAQLPDAAVVKLFGGQVPVTVTTRLGMPPEDVLGEPADDVPLTVVLSLSTADAARVAELEPETAAVVTMVVLDQTSGRRWAVARFAHDGLVGLPYRSPPA